MTAAAEPTPVLMPNGVYAYTVETADQVPKTFAGWTVWTGRVDPLRKKVVAIVPGISAIPGKLIVSPEDNYSGDIERKAVLIGAAPELLRLLKLAADNIQGCIDEKDLPSTVIARHARELIAKTEGRT